MTFHKFSFRGQDAALDRRFQQVMVEPPSVLETVSILRGLRERCVPSHNLNAHQQRRAGRGGNRERPLPVCDARRIPDDCLCLCQFL